MNCAHVHCETDGEYRMIVSIAGYDERNQMKQSSVEHTQE